MKKARNAGTTIVVLVLECVSLSSGLLDRYRGMNQIKSSAKPRSGRPSRSFKTCPTV